LTRWSSNPFGASADVIARQKERKAAIHVVSAFRSAPGCGGGQIQRDCRHLLAVEGAVVTIAAMSCQREIARKAIDNKADYSLALNGNHGTLREDIALFTGEHKENGCKDTKITHHEVVGADHGRNEPVRSSTISLGYRNATNGQDCKALLWSRASVRSLLQRARSAASGQNRN
jgi:hypothetical protein